MQSCRFGRNFNIFSSKIRLFYSLSGVSLRRKDHRYLSTTFSCFRMEQNAENVKEGTLPEAGSEVKTASQLKKEAKRLEKLEKFKKKKEAQEAEKINQTEVSTYQIRRLKNTWQMTANILFSNLNITTHSVPFCILNFRKRKTRRRRKTRRKWLLMIKTPHLERRKVKLLTS